MKTNLYLLLLVLSFNLNGQIRFEKGYFIDNANRKTECFVKNLDWKNNPDEFEYKLNLEGAVEKGSLENIQEFAIQDAFKFIKKTVNIDKSSELTHELSNDNKPIFKQETVFLKVLVEGKANLYHYKKDNLSRFFYSKEDAEIEPLVYKKYLINGNKIAYNEQFKNQIMKDLGCESLSKSQIKNLNYKVKSLLNYFVDYNNCEKELSSLYQNESKGLFNLNIRPRINSTSVSVQNTTFFDSKIDLKNKVSFSAGLEFEYVLPYNKNKWSIFVEPNYQSYKSESTNEANHISGGILVTNLQYQSINLPIGLRRFFFLSDNSKLFIDAAYTLNFNVGKSFLTVQRADGSTFNEFNIDENNNNFSFGVGYKFMDKYAIQFRAKTKKNILSQYKTWNSDYTNISLILGYTIF